MSESKIPWPIWAAVMLACAVIAAWASRPQTDGQTVEDMQRKISSLEAQLNRQQPTYSPSVSEPSPSPKAIPAPTPTITTEPTPNLSNPKWDYSVFNSDIKTQDGSYEGSYKLIQEPAFDQQNKQVEWIVQYSIPLVENAPPVQIDINNSLVKIELANGFRAEFIDISGVILEEKNLDEEGQGNRRRYTLRVPNSIWEKWSEVAMVKVLRGRI
ncbi:hypothetical protein [Sphaerospermopsis sp. FACHB-1094]|uniref:hypothetical protein n=1 Tax=Sphaerospermopsis sp. FACHB-1094 TaxID=2692861 RepID=UPI00168309D5|nr:hypothetical protein [Sphaerospermopsis sp. FACHB-1094]